MKSQLLYVDRNEDLEGQEQLGDGEGRKDSLRKKRRQHQGRLKNE